MITKENIWQTVLGEIEVQISRPNFLTWLKQSQLIEKDEKTGGVIVSLPNNFAKEWVKNRYHKLILGSLRNIDSTVRNIEYVVVNQNQPASFIKKGRGESVEFRPQETFVELKVDPLTNLNPRYVLKSYVVGASNELAHAAVQAIVKNVGKKYNPLFIYGGVGLGKTHLIQATGNEIQELYNKKVRVLYASSEKFINDVVWAIRNKRTDDLKKKYRDIDVLIVDDIQFIGGKAATEQEFFHTFNMLYENNKQIIISSDRPPAAIPTLEERLRSRFEGGMIVDVGYPDYEMRLAILKNKMLNENWRVDGKILEIIATKIQKNIRELEGVFNKVVFYQKYKKEVIDSKKLEEIISEITQITHKSVGINDVLGAVADYFEISPSDLINRSRKKEVVEPRQIAIYLLRDILKLSYPHIGEKLGKRDHTTAIYAYEKISKKINQNPSLNQKILMIKEKIYK